MVKTIRISKYRKGIFVHCPECGETFTLPIKKIATELGSLGGLRRKANLSPKERSRQASRASRARWGKEKKQ